MPHSVPLNINKPFLIQTCASFVTLRSLSLPVLRSYTSPCTGTLPTLSQRLADRFRVSDVVDLHTHALLDQNREDPRMRRAADKPPGNLDERPKPALEHRLDMWRRRVRHGW